MAEEVKVRQAKQKDQASEVEQSHDPFDNAHKKFYDYVEEQIAMMNSRAKLISSSNISFFELNEAMVGYTRVLEGLISAYTDLKIEVGVAEAKLDIWYSDKYMQVRNENNLKTEKTATWLSQKEIDAIVKSKFKAEYSAYKAECIRLDAERSYVERKIKAWETYNFLLGQLSRNLIAETNANLGSYEAQMGGFGENAAK